MTTERRPTAPTTWSAPPGSSARAPITCRPGTGDRASSAGDSWTHTMSPTPVASAAPQPGGGFRYRIGARGEPELLCGATDPQDWLSIRERAGPARMTGFWNSGVANGASLPPGSASSAAPASATPAPASPLAPNAGGFTTGVFAGWSCTDNYGDTDCTASPFLLGPSPNGALANPAITPGFGNVVLVMTTDGDGHVVRCHRLLDPRVHHGRRAEHRHGHAGLLFNETTPGAAADSRSPRRVPSMTPRARSSTRL